MKTLLDKSKFLSFLLRHKPQVAKLTLDREGWCAMSTISQNTDITLDDLLEITRSDDKKRYTIKGDKIRANQGHSTPLVELTFEKRDPPAVLYHGTTLSSWNVIKTDGLKSMSRHMVHLTDDQEIATSVSGRRRGGRVIVIVDAAAASAAGLEFFVSDNEVWLVKEVPPQYIKGEI